MAGFIAKRLAIWTVSLFGASILIFGLMSSLGGDAASVLAGDQATPQVLTELRHELGLDRPVWVRYTEWMGGMIGGDVGISPVTMQNISEAITRRMGITIPLAMASLIVSLLIGVPLGLYAAIHRKSIRGLVASVASQIGMAVPTFWSALLLATIVGLKLGWLPVGGVIAWSDDPVGFVRSMILPTLALGLVGAATFARYVRSAFIEVMAMDFIRTARAKGLSPRAALYRHGLRNIAVPLITVIGVQFAVLLGGAVVIESVFFLPGVGSLVLESINARDTEMVQSTIMVLTFITLLVNFVVDVLYGWIDPRIRTTAAQ